MSKRTAFGRKEQVPTRPSPDYKNINAGDLSYSDICKHLGITSKKGKK